MSKKRKLRLNWVQVGAGRLALRGRPGARALARLPATGCQHVVTLLSRREGGSLVGAVVQNLGLRWTWIPLENADYPVGTAHEMLLNHLPSLSQCLDNGEAILIHCAAGIHRIGMMTYALLRWRGHSAEQARDLIIQLRPYTCEGMHPRHWAWGDDLVNE